MLTELVRPFEGAQTVWTYEPSQPRLGIVIRRWWARPSRGPAPAWKVLVPAAPKQRWLVYFIYLTDGQLSSGQRFTLERLGREDASLMVICACPENHPVLEELRPLCQALYWKAEQGWDFSAYAVALSELARLSPGADVLVMNDSVYGPFKPLVPFMDAAPCRFTGFTGNSLEENHIQSYAFVVKSIDVALMAALAPVMSTAWSYNAADPVILLQETLLARVAAPHFSIGAFWYGNKPEKPDLCLFYPKELIEAGFPFLKRSLVGKFAAYFQKQEEVRALLESLGHPLN